MANISHFTQTVNGVSTTYDIHDANAIPRSGGPVITGTRLAMTVNNDILSIVGGNNLNNGGTIVLYGKYQSTLPGSVCLHPSNGTNSKDMFLKPDGAWTWNGQAVQLISDRRLKQQIAEIDDKLLDAWEDVNLVQFKYNDAVDQKKDKA